ncbi:MAG: carbohydrate kinase [Deltaproteobacteria bacterium]|nr:carbohydrate kinase [Deltaproteobacteria bacterium]
MPTPDLDVVSFGEALVDLLPDSRGKLRDCERFEVHSGGAPANVAVGLARQGKRVAFAGVVGNDEFGHLLSRKLTNEGIETHLRLSDDARTGMWFVALDERGDRSFFTPTGANSADKLVREADLPDALLARTRWLHVGSSAHVLPEAQPALRDAVARAHARNIFVSFDPNLRLHLWRDVRDLQALVRDVFPRCSVVKLSLEEIELCTGATNPEGAASWLVDRGVQLACITLGADGALLQRGKESWRVPSPAVDVVDTTGAGDGFVAGLLAELGDAGPTAASPAIDAAARHACTVGAQVCTRLGAVAGLPTRNPLAARALKR